MDKDNSPKTIDEYIELQSEDKQKILIEFRKTIKEAIPEATEKISWQMPTFYYLGNVIHFAAQKRHVGLHPGPNAIVVFQEELKEYKTSKGAIQIPYDKAIPSDLIKRIARFSLEENIQRNEEKLAAKGKKKV
ncbi:DUF1801 domain-containing protein [Tissierella sp. Yu-01]|uniref:iron chaperone n=1 Tax=Tissierella sp. Yu-01 TaxID=3035694 RepID=UPI00240E846F|nr:DUF1801 domain-containing protein [Tissierella sp. Yu-01]WFA08764.1 DUF1801 domain-containing protein [Tissierella sp. Yu-01]